MRCNRVGRSGATCLRRTHWRIASALVRCSLISLGLCSFTFPISAQQTVDLTFDTRVASPAFASQHTLVLVDEGHRNSQIISGPYAPFAGLLRHDGYRVEAFRKTLDRVDGDVLVIANARGEANDAASAFTAAEIEKLYRWVSEGGSLLLVADHTPFGSAAESLARRFGVEMGKGIVLDPKSRDIEGNPTNLVYSDDNQLLMDHPIIRGRTGAEHVHRVVAFTGQSLQVNDSSAVVLRIGPTAFEVPGFAQSEDALAALGYVGATRIHNPDSKRVMEFQRKYPSLNAQMVAIRVGRGRVVVAGEAAMFSAQILRFTDNGKEMLFKMGMNAGGNDDKQLVLNIMHWLSGLLQ